MFVWLEDTRICQLCHRHIHGHFLDLFLIDQYTSLKNNDDTMIDTYLERSTTIYWENK